MLKGYDPWKTGGVNPGWNAEAEARERYEEEAAERIAENRRLEEEQDERFGELDEALEREYGDPMLDCGITGCFHRTPAEARACWKRTTGGRNG